MTATGTSPTSFNCSRMYVSSSTFICAFLLPSIFICFRGEDMTYLTFQYRNCGKNCADKRNIESIEQFDYARQSDLLLPNQTKSKRLIPSSGIDSDSRPCSTETSDYWKDSSICHVGADYKSSGLPANRKGYKNSLNDHLPRASSHSKRCDLNPFQLPTSARHQNVSN